MRQYNRRRSFRRIAFIGYHNPVMSQAVDRASASSMTPRQRWLTFLEGRQPDRIPTDYWATAEFHNRLRCDLRCPSDEILWQRLHIDRPASLIDPLNGLPAIRRRDDLPPLPPETDIWGVRYQSIDYGSGAYTEAANHPLAIADSADDVRRYPLPSADDFDYDGLSRFLDANDGKRLICAASYEPFLLYCHIRGMEQSYEDLLVNPEIAATILGRLFEFYYEHNRRIFQAGKGRIDLTYIAEDLGGQIGPLFSLEVYRRFLLPNQQRMADLARSFNIHVMYHTDGAARVFLPDLVDVVGIEILNPIQWRCPGMERENLVRDFGRRVIFHGGMDNQQTLPFGTVEQVREEVKQNLAVFENARWICARATTFRRSRRSKTSLRCMRPSTNSAGGRIRARRCRCCGSALPRESGPLPAPGPRPAPPAAPPRCGLRSALQRTESG